MSEVNIYKWQIEGVETKTGDRKGNKQEGAEDQSFEEKDGGYSIRFR